MTLFRVTFWRLRLGKKPQSIKSSKRFWWFRYSLPTDAATTFEFDAILRKMKMLLYFGYQCWRLELESKERERIPKLWLTEWGLRCIHFLHLNSTMWVRQTSSVFILIFTDKIVATKQTRSVSKQRAGTTQVLTDALVSGSSWRTSNLVRLCLHKESFRPRGWNTSDFAASAAIKDSVKDALTITVKVLKESISAFFQRERRRDSMLLFNFSPTLSVAIVSFLKEAAETSRTTGVQLEQDGTLRTGSVSSVGTTWTSMTDFSRAQKNQKKQFLYSYIL